MFAAVKRKMNDLNYNIKSMSIFSFQKNIGETMIHLS